MILKIKMGYLYFCGVKHYGGNNGSRGYLENGN